MNQSGDIIAGLDSNSREKYHVADASLGRGRMHASFGLGHIPSSSSMGSKPAAWSLHRMDNGSIENGIPSNCDYHHDQQTDLAVSSAIQDGISAASHVSSSSGLGTAKGSQEYTGYTSYPSSVGPYEYGNAGYQGQGYYYGYQQQTNPSYSQQVGAYQTSGAPYQSLTSFQNTSSYVAPTSYSGTYYNTGDYQTSGGYQSSSYANQTNLWSDGNYLNHHYSGYTSSDSNGTHSTSSGAGAPNHYQKHYKPWVDYYSQKASEVSCAPGTENIHVTTTTTPECPIPGISGGYASSNCQPPPPGTTSWRPDSSSSQLPSVQASVPIFDSHDDYWKHVAPGFQNNRPNQMPSYCHKLPDSDPLHYDTFVDKQKAVCPPAPSLQYPTNQVPQNFQLPLQTVLPLQPVPTLDTGRVSTLQIPTNPRIASGLPLGIAKADKDSSAKTDAATKPAYISVSVPKPNNTVSSHDAADAMLKPGVFPASLRAYVERALACCKDDTQKAACQTIMKEIITKASSDGTLFTRNWDTEPLFRIPNLDSVDKGSLQTSIIASSLSKYKRSPTRRTKSRWEPISDEKLIEKLDSVSHDPLKDVSWDRLKERERVGASGRSEIKEDSGSNSNFFQPQQQNVPSKNVQRLIKKQRLGESLNATENGDASSDSDREQGLTAYYSTEIALANSPEERKKRENRSKRFEKGHGHRAKIKHFRPKGAGTGNLYARRTSALLLSKNHDDSSREVEDIDWDALTVKGTCLEIEKRYLRLTSAPDPNTVRPEEVLEKALLMVQNSQKNYLYKCDQLKSIRQDLTVQRIHNELTVKVYETHARLALEAGDLPEYNQCQSQLKSLYAEGIKGCDMEFSAYNLLCVILHSNNNRDLLSAMARLSVEAKQDEAIKHALAVRAAFTSGNYILFFRLYKTAPNLATCLMDLYVEKMRFEAVKCMSRSYRPTIPVVFIARVLGFTNVMATEGNDGKDADGVEECEEWLKAHGANIIIDNSGEMQLDTKVTSSSLYMPDPEDAVAHGDASLAVSDFLTRTS